jgi:hypothetical protein
LATDTKANYSQAQSNGTRNIKCKIYKDKTQISEETNKRNTVKHTT